MEKKRCQLGCRWVQILCILPDNDGRRETIRNGSESKEKRRGERERATEAERENVCVLETKPDRGG